MQAQSDSSDKARRQRIVDDVLKGLIDSEMMGEFEDIAVEQRHPSNVAPGPATEVTIDKVRRVLEDFANEAQRFVSGLSNDIDYIPGVRPLIGDAIQVRAAAVILADKSKRSYNHQNLAVEFEALDQQWRKLAYRLRQVTGLDRTCLQRIDKLDQYDRELGKLFSVDKQFDRHDLAARTAALVVDLHNLREDIELELGQSDSRYQLMMTTQNLKQQAEHITDILRYKADYDTIVLEYKKFQEMWHPHAARLRPIQNRYIERNVRRIADADRHLHALL